MAKLSRYAMILALWDFGTVPLSFSGLEQNLSTPPPPPSFEADLLRIDGNSYYVVKDIVGVERQVHVGKDTEIFGQAKAGDRIQLWVQPDGHAQTIIIVMSGMR
jgi:hypothetical protein